MIGMNPQRNLQTKKKENKKSRRKKLKLKNRQNNLPFINQFTLQFLKKENLHNLIHRTRSISQTCLNMEVKTSTTNSFSMARKQSPTIPSTKCLKLPLILTTSTRLCTKIQLYSCSQSRTNMMQQLSSEKTPFLSSQER